VTGANHEYGREGYRGDHEDAGADARKVASLVARRTWSVRRVRRRRPGCRSQQANSSQLSSGMCNSLMVATNVTHMEHVRASQDWPRHPAP
jgi:hypothetical protein